MQNFLCDLPLEWMKMKKRLFLNNMKYWFKAIPYCLYFKCYPHKKLRLERNFSENYCREIARQNYCIWKCAYRKIEYFSNCLQLGLQKTRIYISRPACILKNLVETIKTHATCSFSFLGEHNILAIYSRSALSAHLFLL